MASDVTTAVERAAGPPRPGRRIRRPGRMTLLRLAGAVLAGVLLYLSFPPRTAWWLAPLAFVLLGLVLHGRRAWAGFGYGLVFGLTFFLALVYWLQAFLGADFGPAPWLGVSAVEALAIGLSTAAMTVVARLPGSYVWMAGLYLTGEALRSRLPFNGFPWGRLGFGQADGPLLPLASVGGAPLVGFVVALAGFAVARLIVGAAGDSAEDVAGRRRSDAPVLRRPAAPARSAGPVAAVLLPLLAGLALAPSIGVAAQAGTLRVATVQGNAPNLGVRLIEASEQIRQNHLAATHRLAADIRAGRVPRPQLLIWPETATDVGDDPAADAAIGDAVRDVGVPALIGARVRGADGKVTNSVLQWLPGVGPVARYDKQERVPFAEYVPLRTIAAWFTPFAAGTADMVPGERPGVFHVAGTTVGTIICYEAAYDYAARDAVDAGARLIVVPTNNAWFGDSEMSYQQLGMSRLRAVEHGRAVVVSATSGVSAIVAPDGTVRRQTELFTADDLVATVPLRDSQTVADKLGPWSERLWCGLGVAALLAGIVVRARRRSGLRQVRAPGGVRLTGEE